jgi:sarcosine oxidase subunit gamma
MSDATHTPQSALGGAVFNGYATVREIGPLGMISLRCAADVAALPGAVLAAVGLPMPDARCIVQEGERSVGWMSPDEWLLILPYGDVQAALARLVDALAGQHHLAADVSDARAVFRVEGAQAAEVLAKLAPVDFAGLAPNELRRTRAAQVAAAMWRQGDGFTVVSFRSVAGYVMGLLSHSAQPGSEVIR